MPAGDSVLGDVPGVSSDVERLLTDLGRHNQRLLRKAIRWSSGR
jgi:hypothetical protein